MSLDRSFGDEARQRGLSHPTADPSPIRKHRRAARQAEIGWNRRVDGAALRQYPAVFFTTWTIFSTLCRCSTADSNVPPKAQKCDRARLFNIFIDLHSLVD
jgi:hypothetical protein